MFENLVKGKLATTPSGLKKYLRGYLIAFLLLAIPGSLVFGFNLSALLLTVLFYGIPFILCLYFMYAMIYLVSRKNILYFFSFMFFSFLYFELFTLVFYDEPYLIHELKDGKFPGLTVVNLLASFFAAHRSILPEKENA